MKLIRNCKDKTWSPAVTFILTAMMAAVMLYAVSASAQTYEAAQSVNLRGGPSDDSAIIRALEAGERVEKIGSSGGFIQVRTAKGEEGYVWSSFLKMTAEGAVRVPSLDEFAATLGSGAPSQKEPGPRRYFFETVLEFLRIENHSLYVVLLPLLIAIALGAGAWFLFKPAYRWTDAVLPAELSGARRTTIRMALLVIAGYLLTAAAVYFLDLSLHYAALEEVAILVMILAAPRIILAAPLAVLDALSGNWIIGLGALLLLILIGWPGLKLKDSSMAAGAADPSFSGRARKPDASEMAPEHAATAPEGRTPERDEALSASTQIVAKDDDSGNAD